VNIKEIHFTGLIQNRDLAGVTGPEFFNAIAKCGWKEGTGTHFLKELRKDAAARGIRTPGDLGRQIANGRSVRGRDGKWEHWVCNDRAVIIYNPATRTLITFTAKG
jgi:hypothetical protein